MFLTHASSSLPPSLPQVKKIIPFKDSLELAGSGEEPGATEIESVLKTMNLVLDGYDYEVEFLAQNLVTSVRVREGGREGKGGWKSGGEGGGEGPLVVDASVRSCI
jgi:hypothetical protein